MCSGHKITPVQYFTGLALQKYGPNWFYVKVAEEASEVIHDALKLSAIETIPNNRKLRLEAPAHHHNLVTELAQLRVYMDLLIDYLGADQEFLIAQKNQVERIANKFRDEPDI